MSILTIALKKEIATSIGLRQTVLVLNEQVKKENSQVILDFAGVEFVSRAAVHEFLLLEDTLKAQNIKVHFEYLAEDVAKMFDMVRKSRLAPNAKKPLKFKRMDAKSFFAMS